MGPDVDTALPHHEELVDAGVEGVENDGAGVVLLDDGVPDDPGQSVGLEHVEGRARPKEIGQRRVIDTSDSRRGRYDCRW